MKDGGGKRGRPAKKPGFDAAGLESELIEKAAGLFEEPYDDREERPANAPTLTYVAEEMGTTILRARKLLITAGMFTTRMSRKVQDLHSQGHSIEEIMDMTGLGKASVHSYLPYKRMVYNLGETSANADRTRSYRRRIKACNELLEHKHSLDADEYLWNAILAFEGYVFYVREGDEYKRMTYEAIGDRIIVNGDPYSKDYIASCYRHASAARNGCLHAILNRIDETFQGDIHLPVLLGAEETMRQPGA